jgi:hypothetical protein
MPCRAVLGGAAGLTWSESGERGLAVQNQHVILVTDTSSKHVVLFLEPGKLGFQVTNALLQAAHLGDHAGIRTTDVAE